MSKERELLERVLDEEDDGISFELSIEIKELLDQPESEHKTCSLSFLKGYSRGFLAGCRNAEKAHGIGGGE